MLKFIDGGVCAAQGFRAAGVHAGVKTHADWKKDVALIVSDVDCAAAAVFTKNVVKAAPIRVDLRHLADGKARAVIANSGNANACAPQGEENAERMCAAAAKAIGCPPEDVLVSSTGVIGQRLRVEVIEEHIPELYKALARSAEASDAAGHAIMTTDLAKKEVAVETTVGGKTVRMGGIAKGSGMIHPNMGTMLCFLTTDCAISPAMIKAALLETVKVSFNRISVDGDTSTNDTCLILASGGPEGPVRGAGQANGLRRRGSPAPDHLYGRRREVRGERGNHRQVRRLLHADQGRDFWSRRQLGPGPLRHGVFRGGLRPR